MTSNTGRWIEGLKTFLFVWMTLVLIAAIKYAPEATNFQSTSKVLFLHVPMAWVAVLAFLVSAFFSVAYLRGKRIESDVWASSSAGLGFLFCILATVTGSIWAKLEWGSFWNWDPRESSIIVLLLIYAAYFALRSALDNQEQKMQLSAVYSILAFVTVPFLIFVIPRIIFSLHPDNPIMANDPEMEMTSKIRTVFFASLFGFSLLYFLMLRMKAELEFIRNKFASVGETT